MSRGAHRRHKYCAVHSAAANAMVEFEEFVMLMRKHKALVNREADMRQAFRVSAVA